MKDPRESSFLPSKKKRKKDLDSKETPREKKLVFF